ncbi:MAG TPA: hypothetical protein VJ976_09690 [Ornithinimicrobium sp.]|uniref:hypothetical protein n=1 Tax=Ornithinimicrobium sp. TaxID=1977084 RepID=UPI002B4A0D30|nr:hypothetical protein [Ornithinimicrobium sp.]HKJ12640.1 hypothetical protein [Ornithinimicrobium sp.]
MSTPGGAAQAAGDDAQTALLGVYRTLPARLLGWTVVSTASLVGFVVVRGELSLGRNVLFPVAVVLFVIALVWVLLLRPRVELRADSVTQRNILRDVVVPFERLAAVGSRWALELTDTTGRTYSSWAVPKQREFSARRAFDDFAETTSRARARPGTTAQVVAGDTERAFQRWQMGGGAPQPQARADLQWAPAAVVPLAASTALLALAIAAESA